MTYKDESSNENIAHVQSVNALRLLCRVTIGYFLMFFS